MWTILFLWVKVDNNRSKDWNDAFHGQCHEDEQDLRCNSLRIQRLNEKNNIPSHAYLFFHNQKMHFFLIDAFPVIAVGKNWVESI